MTYKYGTISGGMAILVFWTVFMSGAMMGAHTGYQATTAEEATVEYNGTHFRAGSNVTETTIDWEKRENNPKKFRSPTEEWFSEYVDLQRLNDKLPEFNNERSVRASRAFVENMVHVSYQIAAESGNFTAKFIYNNKWIPKQLLSAFFRFLGLAPILGYAGYAVLKVRRLI